MHNEVTQEEVLAVVSRAQSIFAGRVASIKNVYELAEALKQYFAECGQPLYFIMAADPEPVGTVPPEIKAGK